jgi:membrane-bound metal-dependent hydrolase YbcI (DUF457 family)
MLPTGHIAGGYLTGYALLKIAKPSLSPQELNQLLYWAMFFAFSPDIDVFWFFFKKKALLVSPPTDKNHRQFISHTPLPWLVAGLLIYFFAPFVYIKYIGLLFWLGSWSHLLLDSIDYGIMWLWPFSNKVYGLTNGEKRFVIEEKGFFAHNIKFLKLYSRQLTFYCEIVIILIAILLITNVY